MKASRSLKSRALQLLAQRDQSRAELRRKLLAYEREARRISAAGDVDVDADIERNDSGTLTGALLVSVASENPDATVADTPADVDAVLDWLEANRLLSNERFAEVRIHARAPRFGNLRIRQELARHEVTLTPEAQQALADSELERARTVRARKFAARPATPAEQARQARFLGARGFSPDVIRKVLRDAARRIDEPD
jgi:regulatory protein